MTITVADIEAMSDVLNQLAEQSDELTAEQAVLIDKALAALGSKVRDTRDLVKAQAVKALDGQPIAVGGSVFVAKAEGKMRPNHEAIRAAAIHFATVDMKTGEILKGKAAVPKAAAQAVHAMYELFVAESTVPKKAGLDLIHLSPESAKRWERTGSKIEEVVVDGGRD